jgi:hypothetical protein
MNTKWIVWILLLTVVVGALYSWSTRTYRSDVLILRDEFDIPRNARVLYYNAMPQTGLIPWPREALDIELIFQFESEEFEEYVRAAKEAGNWQKLPIPDGFFPERSPKFDLTVSPASGFFQCRTAGDDIMHTTKTIRTDLGDSINDLMLSILDSKQQQLIIKVRTGY